MDVFANFVLLYLSDFKLGGGSVHCLSKKSIVKSIFRRSVSVHQYCSISLVNAIQSELPPFFLNFCMRIGLLFCWNQGRYSPHFLIRVLSFIRIFSSVFSHPYPPSVSAIRIRVLSLPEADNLKCNKILEHSINVNLYYID